LTFCIEELPGGNDRSKFVWGDFVDLSSDAIVTALPSAKGDDIEDIAVTFLEDALSAGPVEYEALKGLAERHAVSEKSLERAASKLGVRREDDCWSLKKKRAA